MNNFLIRSILLAFIIIGSSSALQAQASGFVNVEKSLSRFAGRTVTLGFDGTYKRTNLGIGFSFFEEGSKRGVADDFGSSGKGLSAYFTRFFENNKPTGLYYGLRTDLQITRSDNPGFLGRSTGKSTQFFSHVFAQFGYSTNTHKPAFLRLQYSLGYRGDRGPLANQLGILFMIKLKSPEKE